MSVSVEDGCGGVGVGGGGEEGEEERETDEDEVRQSRRRRWTSVKPSRSTSADERCSKSRHQSAQAPKPYSKQRASGPGLSHTIFSAEPCANRDECHAQGPSLRSGAGGSRTLSFTPRQRSPLSNTRSLSRTRPKNPPSFLPRTHWLLPAPQACPIWPRPPAPVLLVAFPRSRPSISPYWASTPALSPGPTPPVRLLRTSRAPRPTSPPSPPRPAPPPRCPPRWAHPAIPARGPPPRPRLRLPRGSFLAAAFALIQIHRNDGPVVVCIEVL